MTSCAFSGDGKLLATGSNDRSVMIWKVLTEDGLTEGRNPASPDYLPRRRGLVVSVTVSHDVVLGSCPGRVIPKIMIKMVHTASLLGTQCVKVEFDSTAWLSKRLVSVWNCLWGYALKRSPGINRKSRVLYQGPGFLSSALGPSMLKKSLLWINQSINPEYSGFHHCPLSKSNFNCSMKINI